MTDLKDWKAGKIAQFDAEADELRERIRNIDKALGHCRFWQVSKRNRLEARADGLAAELAEVRAEAIQFARKYEALA